MRVQQRQTLVHCAVLHNQPSVLAVIADTQTAEWDKRHQKRHHYLYRPTRIDVNALSLASF